MTSAAQQAHPNFKEHAVARDRGNLYVREYAGAGPTFVLMHGFPDNLHIYDDLVPHLVAGGRHVVTFDFMGFGASDKPERARYSFEQQLGDLEAVVEALKLETIIPVGHDSGGPAAMNFGLQHPEQTATVCLMNAFYGDAPGQHVPEFIELFANKNLKTLSRHFLASPQQFAWLLNFQREQMQQGLTEAQRAHYNDFLGPVIDGNFRQKPSAGPAFAQMTFQLYDELAANTARLKELRRATVPFLFIWGKSDPYLHPTVAEYLRTQTAKATLHVLEAGHWPQIDQAAEVARLMLGKQ